VGGEADVGEACRRDRRRRERERRKRDRKGGEEVGSCMMVRAAKRSRVDSRRLSRIVDEDRRGCASSDEEIAFRKGIG
jgi:hypothetical protein